MSKQKIDVNAYCEAHTSPPSASLRELERITHLTTLAPQMISGHLQGRLLSMLSHILRPTTILEIGTFTGYSAICLAEGLSAGGTLHTIEINPEYQTLSKKYAEEAGFAQKIVFHAGDALEIIPQLELTFDLAFIDAAKTLYQDYFDLLFVKVRKGGIILIDNLLWSGKVLGAATDAETEALRDFSSRIQSDDRLENILLPVRDGLMICRKI